MWSSVALFLFPRCPLSAHIATQAMNLRPAFFFFSSLFLFFDCNKYFLFIDGRHPPRSPASRVVRVSPLIARSVTLCVLCGWGLGGGVHVGLRDVLLYNFCNFHFRIAATIPFKNFTARAGTELTSALMETFSGGQIVACHPDRMQLNSSGYDAPARHTATHAFCRGVGPPPTPTTTTTTTTTTQRCGWQ